MAPLLYNQSLNEILPFLRAWLHLQGIVLSEISQTEKDQLHEISPICETQITTTNHSKWMNNGQIRTLFNKDMTQTFLNSIIFFYFYEALTPLKWGYQEIQYIRNPYKTLAT